MPFKIENDHNVYILGAGFSARANMPLVSNFLTRMRDSYPWLISERRKREAEAVQAVLEFRRSASSAAYWVNLDLENIEELFSLASSKSRSLSNSIRIAIAATLDYSRITKTQEHTLISYEGCSWAKSEKWLKAYPAQGNNHYRINEYSYHIAQLLGMCADGKVKGRNTFISFNYDTILEESLSDLGLDYDYHLGISKITSVEQSKISVLKLHGSVNWARGEMSAEKNKRRRPRAFHSYSDVRDANRVPELIAPTWRKIFGSHLSAIWDESIQALQDATRVVVIGFSIPPTDTHFKYLLAAGFQENLSLRKITFFDPQSEDLKRRAQSLFQGHSLAQNKVIFEKITLEDLTKDNNHLSSIGRPQWIKGMKNSMQWHGLQ
ncbi:SIR2 family protein [Termitidicoccus mucosus]|uniref:hypothetical protein n=1 Tax=Termitidicoccus mucosus TaxID=1184151 RepID=UPI00318399FB